MERLFKFRFQRKAIERCYQIGSSKRIAACQGDGEVELPGGVTLSVTASLTRPQLGRIRAQFLQFAKSHPPRCSNPQEAAKATAQMFASFISTRLQAM
ncbi:hypothetical protein B566_EDAN007997 [Ephemera danica]|nr:hypothetical protein B566_EDAN007997 [Ephemera danica]